MHGELERIGVRRTRALVVALIAIGAIAGAVLGASVAFDPQWPIEDSIAGGWRAPAVGAALGVAWMVALLALGERRARRRAWPVVAVAPAPHLVPLAEGIAIARGVPTPSVWTVDSTAPNVGCLPGPGGRHLVVTTTAAAGLSRDELEAVMAMQLSLLLDDDVRGVRRALIAGARSYVWVVVASVVACVVMVVRNPDWSGLTINIAVWTAILTIVLVAVTVRRLRWSWGLLADAVAIATTRHPEPLASALRKLAGHNEGSAPVRSGFGASDPFWAVTVRSNAQVAYMVTNDRARRRSSTKMVADTALLLRARVVELCALGGQPATLATWQHARQTILRLSQAAGDYTDGGPIDAAIDGVTVTLDGAQGAPPPIGGSWEAAAAAAGATDPGHRLFGRPRLPSVEPRPLPPPST